MTPNPGVEAVISDRVLDQLNRETAQARGLPNEAFTTDAFLDLENRYVFPGTWGFGGVASGVPNIGDVQPVQVAGRALFMVRGADGEIRVFQNVCPHRGARLVVEPIQAAAALTCPYHAWSYELSGELKGRPHYHGPERHGKGDGGNDPVCLFAVRSVTWHDWVFINLDGEAQAFDDYMAPVISRFAGYDLQSFHCGHYLAFDFACNWKLAIENYCDSYHVFNLHPALNDMHPASERFAMQPDGNHLFNGFHFAGPGRGLTIDPQGPVLPNLPGLSEEFSSRMQWASLFPNAAINICPSNLQFLLFEPNGVHRSVVHMWFYFVGDAAHSSTHREAREQLYAEWINLNAEDEGVCQRLQQGRGCDAYDGGRLAPYWDTSTVHFHKQIAHAIHSSGGV